MTETDIPNETDLIAARSPPMPGDDRTATGAAGRVSLWHIIAHWLSWQYVEVVTAWSGDTLWIAFRCTTCGKVTGAHRSITNRPMVPESEAAIAGLHPPMEWH